MTGRCLLYKTEKTAATELEDHNAMVKETNIGENVI